MREYTNQETTPTVHVENVLEKDDLVNKDQNTTQNSISLLQ